MFTDSGGHQSGRSEKRDGWQAVIARVEEGGVAGIVAYDISRLARNARLILNLHHALEQTGADLRVAQMPDARWGSPEGRFLLGQLALAAQFQADYDSKRMIDMHRSIYESGGHRGNDPFGYRTKRDGKQIVHPRTLQIVEEEARVVRRVFALLREHSHAEVAAILNREGLAHGNPGPWTHNTAKDIWRRREVYRGNVVTKRGLEPPRPGRHPAILTAEEVRDAEIAVRNRQSRKGRRVRNVKRVYLLSGLAFCGECGHRLRGATQSARGQEWRYYNCPVSEHRSFIADRDGNLVACTQRRTPAALAESAVLDALESRRLPPELVAEAEKELRRRPLHRSEGDSDKERTHLTKRLGALRKQHEWGDLSDVEYRTQTAAIRSDLSALPSDRGKIVEFSTYQRVAASLPDALAVLGASGRPELAQDTLAALVRAVVIMDKRVIRIEPVPAARPFFSAIDDDGFALSSVDSGESRNADDALGWYADGR